MSFGIGSVGVVEFAKITSPAGQRQVGLDIRTFPAAWNDVFHFKREVEHYLWGATVLATMSRANRDLGIERVHRPNS